MEERAPLMCDELHHVQHVIRLVEIEAHSSIPKQGMIEVSLLKNSDRQSMETV